MRERGVGGRVEETRAARWAEFELLSMLLSTAINDRFFLPQTHSIWAKFIQAVVVNTVAQSLEESSRFIS